MKKQEKQLAQMKVEELKQIPDIDCNCECHCGWRKGTDCRCQNRYFYKHDSSCEHCKSPSEIKATIEKEIEIVEARRTDYIKFKID